MGLNDIGPEDLAALLPPDRAGAAAPEGGRVAAPARSVPPARPTWRSVARVGLRDPWAVGTEMFNAHTAYVAALAAVKAGTGAQQRYDAAADALGEVLTMVCTDEALAPFLAGYLRDTCPALTPERARALLRAWERWRQRRSSPSVPMSTHAPSVPMSTHARMVQVERATPRTAPRTARHTVAPASKVAPLATGRAARATPELDAWIVALDKENKYSQEQIGVIVGVSAATVNRRLKQLK